MGVGGLAEKGVRAAVMGLGLVAKGVGSSVMGLGLAGKGEELRCEG